MQSQEQNNINEFNSIISSTFFWFGILVSIFITTLFSVGDNFYLLREFKGVFRFVSSFLETWVCVLGGLYIMLYMLMSVNIYHITEEDNSSYSIRDTLHLLLKALLHNHFFANAVMLCILTVFHRYAQRSSSIETLGLFISMTCSIASFWYLFSMILKLYMAQKFFFDRFLTLKTKGDMMQIYIKKIIS